MSNLNRWAINETLLQSYRSTFISSQSFLLATGAIFTDKNAVLVYVTAIVGMLVIWCIWFPIVKARHQIVDYYKYSAKLDPTSLSKLCSEDEYMTNTAHHHAANALLGVSTHWRKTRIKIDAALPILFSAIWLVLVIYECKLIQRLRTLCSIANGLTHGS